MIERNEEFTAVDYFGEMQRLLNTRLVQEWNEILRVLYHAWKSGSRVLIAGNGGNFLNALHFATDWNKGLAILVDKPLLSVVVGENSGLMSAIENDEPHDNSIINYYKYLGLDFQLMVLLSAGGTSQNILNAACFARDSGITTVGLLGGLSHNNSVMFDYSINVKSDDIHLVEDIHAQLGHTVIKFISSQAKIGLI